MQAPGFPRACRRRQHALIVDEAAEIGVGDRPGVALILDEPMRDGERAPSIAFDQLDRAQQIGHVPVAGVLDQEPADLDLGMNSLVDLAENLHHAVPSTITVVLDCSRLGTVIFSAAGGGICLNALVGGASRRCSPCVDGFAGMHDAEQQRDELLIAAGVDERALRRPRRTAAMALAGTAGRSKRVHLTISGRR